MLSPTAGLKPPRLTARRRAIAVLVAVSSLAVTCQAAASDVDPPRSVSAATECEAVARIAKQNRDVRIDQSLRFRSPNRNVLTRPMISGKPSHFVLRPYVPREAGIGVVTQAADGSLNELPSATRDCSAEFAKVGIPLDTPDSRNALLAAGQAIWLASFSRSALGGAGEYLSGELRECQLGVEILGIPILNGWTLKRAGTGSFVTRLPGGMWEQISPIPPELRTCD